MKQIKQKQRFPICPIVKSSFTIQSQIQQNYFWKIPNQKGVYAMWWREYHFEIFNL